MNNNIGIISYPTKFPRTIGDTLTVTDLSSINTISGNIDLGFIVFDTDGTMAVCTTFTRDANDQPICIFRTLSLNTEIDVQYILSQSY